MLERKTLKFGVPESRSFLVRYRRTFFLINNKNLMNLITNQMLDLFTFQIIPLNTPL